MMRKSQVMVLMALHRLPSRLHAMRRNAAVTPQSYSIPQGGRYSPFVRLPSVSLFASQRRSLTLCSTSPDRKRVVHTRKCTIISK